MSLKNKVRAFGIALALTFSLALTGGAAAIASTSGPPSHGSHVTYYECMGPYYSNMGVYYNCWADWDWYAEFFWGKRDWYVNVKAVYYA